MFRSPYPAATQTILKFWRLWRWTQLVITARASRDRQYRTRNRGGRLVILASQNPECSDGRARIHCCWLLSFVRCLSWAERKTALFSLLCEEGSWWINWWFNRWIGGCLLRNSFRFLQKAIDFPIKFSTWGIKASRWCRRFLSCSTSLVRAISVVCVAVAELAVNSLVAETSGRSWGLAWEFVVWLKPRAVRRTSKTACVWVCPDWYTCCSRAANISTGSSSVTVSSCSKGAGCWVKGSSSEFSDCGSGCGKNSRLSLIRWLSCPEVSYTS